MSIPGITQDLIQPVGIRLTADGTKAKIEAGMRHAGLIS